MKMKKFIAVLSVATMAAGLAVGCGSSDSGSSDDKSSKGDWDSSNDITIVSREDGSGTRGAFIELFGIEEKKDGEKVDMTTDDAQITNSTSVMLTTVAGDDYAIHSAWNDDPANDHRSDRISTQSSSDTVLRRCCGTWRNT